MEKWALLLLSIIGAGITIEAFRWRSGSSRFPFRAISNLWKNGLAHLSLRERERVRERYSTFLFGIGHLPWLMGLVTLALVVATVRAFLEQ